MEIRVASTLASFSTAFFKVPGCPDSLRPAVPSDEQSGFPGSLILRLAGDGASSRLVSRILRRRPLQGFGFPRLPASCRACQCSLQVSPAPAPSGFSGDGDSGCPVSRILQCCWRPISGLPQILLLQPRFPDEAPGCPESCIFRPCRR
jgi:hypothetical protein